MFKRHFMPIFSVILLYGTRSIIIHIYFTEKLSEYILPLFSNLPQSYDGIYMYLKITSKVIDSHLGNKLTCRHYHPRLT